MNVVDSSGWLAYLAVEPHGQNFAEPIEDVENLLVPVITIYEVFKRTLQTRGRDKALLAATMMSSGQVIEVDEQIALKAAELSAELKLPMADSLILATAHRYNATIWTQDRDFEGLENVTYFEKSTGDSDD